MKTSSRHWTPFLVTCVLASVFATGGCSYDASQLRALPGTGGVTGSDGSTATGGVEGSDAAATTGADGPAVVGTVDAGSADGGASDMVTPFPDAPQSAQPDSSEGESKDGVTVVGGADAGNPDGSSDCDNGVLDPGEQCDDRNNQSGDGCSSTCQIEPGWSCTGSPSVCTRTVCGNGILEAGEVCDCGTDPTKLPTGCTGPNGLFNGDGTGCSKTCTKEPICRGTNGTGATHACTPTCGNGNLESGEGCDDGNLVNGDGCSSTCQIEPGFTCTTQTNSDTQPCTQTMYGGQCLDLPVKLRDFKSEHETGGHPDFFYVGAALPSASVTSINGVQGQANPLTFNRRYCTSASNGPARKNDSTARCWSMAQPSLDANGRPVFDITRNGGGSNATLCDCQFTDWSSDTNGGHVPGYTMADSPLNALTFVSGTSGHPLYKGPAPLATSATTFGQWWIDSSYTNNTHTVATLELGPVAGAANLYRYTSAQDSVYGGFFPLDPPANSFPEYTLIGSTAGPGAVLTSTTGNGEPLLCDLWPYWYSSASYGVGASCKGDQYLTAPSFAPGSDPAAWFGQNPAGAWVPQAQGWYHDFWFTVEARYLFTFNGPFQLQFSGSNEIFVFINGVLVVDLGALHNVIPGRVSIDASGNANIQEGGNFYMPCTNPAGKTTCPVIPAGYSVGDMVPCDGGANAVDPVTGVAFNSTCPSGNPTCDCRQRTLTAAALGLQTGSTYEIAIFGANRAPTDSEMQITINGYTTTRSICQHAVSCSNGSHNGGDGNCVTAGTCSAGYHDGGAGTCVAIGSCLTGYHDGGTGTCVATGVCSTGYHDGGTGTCIASETCSTGYHDGGTGTCLASGTCSTGYHDGGTGTCVVSGTCSTGYHNGGTGTCVASGSCSTGYHNGGTGTCVVSGTCSTGYHDGGTGTCMVTGTCSAGYHDGGGGACVASGTCSAGYNNCSGTCSSSSCGGGIGSCTPCPEGYCCH